MRQFVVAGGETSGAVVQALGVTHAAHRRRRSIRACRATRSIGAAADAPLRLALKSGNFGTTDFFAKALKALVSAGMTTTKNALREEICATGASLYRARLHGRQRGQHQRAARRRLADHADRRVPRPPRSRTTSRRSTRRAITCRADAPSKTLALHRAHLREQRRRARRRAHALDASGRADARGRLDARRRPAADHAVLRDEGRPRAADPVPPSGRSGGRRSKWPALASKVRAVLLERLGPVVWETVSCRTRRYALEELEETARLCLCDDAAPEPLPDDAIEDLRTTFGARW